MHSMKTIGIDASALLKTNPTGVENYARLLLGEMMKEPLQTGESVVLYARGSKPEGLELLAGWSWKSLPFWFSKGWTHFRLSKELFEHPVNVFFSPAHEVPLATGSAKVVTTVHDVAFAKNARLYSVLQNFRQRAAVRHAVRVASKLLAVSAMTMGDLVKYFKADVDKITVTHLAPTVDAPPNETVILEVLKKYSLERGKYFLYVGRIEEKKNVGTLVEAFRRYKESVDQTDQTKLALVGGLGFRGQRIIDAAKTSPYAMDIVITGYVPESDIAALYVGALAFIFPSHDEGFGLPILEAMTLGTPVLLSDIPVFHEVAGSAAEYAAPTDPTAFALKMKALIESPELRTSLISRGLAQIEKYSWVKTAKLTWEVLRNV